MALDPRDPILLSQEDKAAGSDPRDPILLSQEDRAAAAEETVDMWYRQAIEPLFREKRQQHAYPALSFWPEPIPPAVGVNIWAQPISMPWGRKDVVAGY